MSELLEARHLVENNVTDMFLIAGICSNIVESYILKNDFDSALYYQKLTMVYENKTSRQIYYGVSLNTIGAIFYLQGKPDSAKKYYYEALKMIRERDENLTGLAHAYISLSRLYYDANHGDSGIPRQHADPESDVQGREAGYESHCRCAPV